MRTLASAAALVAGLVAALPSASARPPRMVPLEEMLDTPPPPPTQLVATRPADPAPAASSYARDRDLYGRWRLSAGVGIRFGSFRINGAGTGTAIPFHLDLGLRKNRLFFFGSYDVLNVDIGPSSTAGIAPRGTSATDSGAGSGLVQRIGANARYAVGRVGERDGGFDVWAEAGVGMQHLAWDAGGVWNRHDVALGIGGTMLGLGRHSHGGFSIGLRVLLAPRADVPTGAPAACGGPCDRATAPSGTDRSFMFDMTVPFGG